MNISTITALYFSPTGSTRKVIKVSCSAIKKSVEMMDVTAPMKLHREFQEDDLVLIGVPVYCGRVPQVFFQRIEQVCGHNTPCVLFVTYGNRAVEDALIELSEAVQEKGLIPIAAAQIVCEHSIFNQVASHRPDALDLAFINTFMHVVSQKLSYLTTPVPVQVSGNIPYRAMTKVALKPQGTADCTRCGKCVALCPAQAIDAQNPRKTDKSKCISCMGCISCCPQNARKVNSFIKNIAQRKFLKKYQERQMPRSYLNDDCYEEKEQRNIIAKELK